MRITYNIAYNYNIPQFNRVQTLKNDNDSFTPNAPAFQANPISAAKDYFRYLKVRNFVQGLANYVKDHPNREKLYFRHVSMEALEGLQYGIKVFKGLSMKDIQYLSENLHVIAVKRGCNNMCGYCYADAKPSKREMSWEDFTSLTQGFKTLKSRLCGFPLFGENRLRDEDVIYKTTELFYDSDCMALAIKDKKGKEHDFRDMVTELYEGLGRRSCFDTSGWISENKIMQKRAEEYAEYFAKPENMDKLNAFNVSFNVFNASNVAAVKAFRTGDSERGKRLQDKFVDRMANVFFTFTPLLNNDKFHVLQRSFGYVSNGSAEGFDFAAMMTYRNRVIKRVKKLYEQDFKGEQKYIKSQSDIEKNIKLLEKKLESIDTGLNSSGRMLEFMRSFGIKVPMQDHTETTKIMEEDLKANGRYHRYLAHKLIDADGRVYHMDYARFFPTEIQLNFSDKSPTPKLANIRDDFVVTKDIINRPEERRPLNDFI